jgi:hypothetical protein
MVSGVEMVFDVGRAAGREGRKLSYLGSLLPAKLYLG